MADTNDFKKKGPLADLRVIEMGVLLAGPFCGQLLADMGAEVIKIEQPGTGDPMREWGREKPYGKSLWWPVVARNKKSITLNLREQEGQQIVRDLVARSDIVLENFRPGTMERWNLGYDDLRTINPKIIMVRVTGFGQDGPYAKQAGFGAIGEAMGGLRYVVGDPSTPPSRMGISIGDSLAATYAAFGTLAALHYREQTGRGQIVDSAIYEAVLAMMESLIPEYQIGDYVRERTGAILPNVSPSNIYPSADDQMVLIAANQDTVFRRMCEAIGRQDWAEDPKFATHSARGENQKELDELIVEEYTSKTPADNIIETMREAGVPVGLIYRAPEMLEDEHFKEREAIVTVEHPEFGDFMMQNVAPKLSETPGHVNWVGPELGQHNEEVYKDLLGMSDKELTAFRDKGLI